MDAYRWYLLNVSRVYASYPLSLHSVRLLLLSLCHIFFLLITLIPTHTARTIRHFNNFSLSQRFKYKWYSLHCVVHTPNRSEKTTKAKRVRRNLRFGIFVFPWCTANGTLLRAIYNEMFKAIEKLNKRHFYSKVQSSFSVSGALVFIDTIQWNQHARLKWWVVKKSPTSTKAVIRGQWLSNWTINNEYNAVMDQQNWLMSIDLLWVAVVPFDSFHISHRFLCSGFFLSFEIQPLLSHCKN